MDAHIVKQEDVKQGERLEEMAAAIDLEIPPECHDGVVANLALLLRHADLLHGFAAPPQPSAATSDR